MAALHNRTGDEVWFHAHAHSHYSVLDGMPTVESMVKRALRNNQPALALTDHGNMSGASELYRHAMKVGIKPFPGSEFYYVKDINSKDKTRYHLTILAVDNPGYRGLIKLSTQSHTRENYHYKPRIDITDLARLSEAERDGMVVMTGCYFGLLAQTMVENAESLGKSRFNKLIGSVMNPVRSLFDNVFVEVQLHDVSKQGPYTENELIALLITYAVTNRLPIIVTQDSHYLKFVDSDSHDMMKKLGYKAGDDMTFPGGPYHLARTAWVKEQWSNYPNGVGQMGTWEAGLKTMKTLLDMHDLSIPLLDNYTYHVPKSIDNPDIWLRKQASKGMRKLDLKKPRYKKRMEHELGVIKKLGMASYFHLIQRGVQFCHDNDIMVAARGSANGSLVCYLLGITQVDPIRWNLLFERFLSLDRKKPPDVDLDIEGNRRDEVIEFYNREYDVCQIGTYGGMGLSLEDGRGSIFVSYLAWLRAMGRTDEIARYRTLHDVPDDIKSELVKLSSFDVKRSAGAHAAGYALGTTDFTIDRWIPKMLIPSSGHMVTQFTMDEVETHGFIKIDLLGQRTLSTMKRTLELIGVDPSKGLDWIPMNDSRTLSLLRSGKTDNGIFQFEGWAAARGCRELPLKSVKDAIAIMALYRPAVMKGYLADYLDVRHGKKKVRYVHPMLEPILKETHGIIIYQEQIMTILREVGVPYEELNQFLSALKMSNHKTPDAIRIFKRQRKLFIQQCQMSKGMSKADADAIWDYVAGFAEYGFNRAHATAYGILGYRMAYLKTNYPLEFMAALLETTAGTEKEKKYVVEARRIGVRLIKADVNASGALWTLDRRRKAVRRGLTSLKGVGIKAAIEIEENAPYDSIEDIIERTNNRNVTGGAQYAKTGELKGVMAALELGGALKELA